MRAISSCLDLGTSYAVLGQSCIFSRACINLQVRQLGHATSQTECLDLAKAERMHSFHKVEEVADKLDGVYCLPKVSA